VTPGVFHGPPQTRALTDTRRRRPPAVGALPAPLAAVTGARAGA